MNAEQVLTSFLEQHPEDFDKWKEFLIPTGGVPSSPRASRDQITNLINVLLEHVPGDDESESDDVPQNEMVNVATVEIPMTGIDKTLPLNFMTRDGDVTRVEEHDPALCNLCRQPYKDTQATVTLLCGHKYHSQCWFLYEEHTSWCNVRGCHKSSIHIMSDAFEKANKTKGDATKSLVRHLKKKKGFVADLKNLKTYCRDVQRAKTLIDCSLKGERRDIIKKHADSLNAIQKDMNDGREKIMKGDEMKLYRQAIRLAKKEASNIFQKYHLDMRDLRNHNLLKISWSVRYAVEHHRSYFSAYKMGIRMYPGRRIFGLNPRRTRLQQTIDEDSDKDVEFSENEV